MKRIILLVLILSGVLLSQEKFSFFDNTNFCKSENCGIVEGQIFDFVTNKKVEESFAVAISQCSGRPIVPGGLILHVIKSNNDGSFKFKIDEGEYCILFFPISKFSKYHGDPYVYNDPQGANHIVVRRWIITYVKKKVKAGGSIGLKFIDLNGNNIDLKKILPKKNEISFAVRSPKITSYYNFYYDLKNFEVLKTIDKAAYNLKPAVYQGIVKFDSYEGIGYASQIIKDIVVEAGKETLVNVVVDKMNSKTGISGIVKDINGLPLQNVEVEISSLFDWDKHMYSDEFAISGKVDTDSNGFYKIVGLNEKYNPYEIYLSYKKKDGSWLQKKIKDIKIIDNRIITKSIILK